MREERERQEEVDTELTFLERINPQGARVIREELEAWRRRSMNQAETIADLQELLDQSVPR